MKKQQDSPKAESRRSMDRFAVKYGSLGGGHGQGAVRFGLGGVWVVSAVKLRCRG